MNEGEVIQGRRIGTAALAQVQGLLAAQPGWSRWRVSVELARLWDWRTPTGQLKDMAARTLLLKLDQRGWIHLPPRRRASPNRMRHKQMPVLEQPVCEHPLAGLLPELLPLRCTEVSGAAGAGERALFEVLLHRHHYLSYRSSVGENLQYLVRERGGRPVACVLFGAAAWQCADRDRYVGWDAATRAQRLPLVTNNTRFLILPWVRVPHLASHILSQIARRLGRDWQDKYGHRIYLLETFVEHDRFAGACYQAANWVRVGQTKGRSRHDQGRGATGRPGQSQRHALPLPAMPERTGEPEISLPPDCFAFRPAGPVPSLRPVSPL